MINELKLNYQKKQKKSKTKQNKTKQKTETKTKTKTGNLTFQRAKISCVKQFYSIMKPFIIVGY